MSDNIEVAALHSGESANVKRVNRAVALDNAAFICRAVNAHDALVEAMQHCLESLDWARKALEVQDHSTFVENINEARAALKLAKGEE